MFLCLSLDYIYILFYLNFLNHCTCKFLILCGLMSVVFFSVVWEYCNYGLVGWPVAQWGLCQLLWVHRCGISGTNLGHGEFCFKCTLKIHRAISASHLEVLSTCVAVVLQRDIMIISDVLPVMVDDALLSSHPIIVDVSTPAEITSVFDAISYSKVWDLSVSPQTVKVNHTVTLHANKIQHVSLVTLCERLST